MSPPGRRAALKLAGAAAFAAALPAAGAAEPDLNGLAPLPAPPPPPIAQAERAARLSRAQGLMAEHKLDAVLIEPGASLTYFTGLEWWRSERLTAAILPREGGPIVVTPAFEEPSVRETLQVPAEVVTWQEDENPFAALGGAIGRRGRAPGAIGIEETVRWFAAQGLGAAMPDARLRSADPVVRGCRMRKSPAEIALMQRAADITIAAYRWTIPRVAPGMTPAEVSAMMNAATTRLGGRPLFALVLMGEAAAYPHGTGKPQRAVAGEVVLMDCGCSVAGYQSDISRTFVPGGRAPDDVRRVWDLVAEGQRIAFAAARPGAPAGSVDEAVRRFYAARGFGPGYRLPGLPHRTGHGIGMDGHEPVNLVRGETTALAAGMCFSNEPGLYLPGRLGVRLEDCFHMTERGPRWFSTPPAGLDAPTG